MPPNYGITEQLRQCVPDPKFCERSGTLHAEACSPNMFRNASYGGIVSNQNLPPFFHQCIQRALDFREIPIRHPGIDLCGLWAYVPEQHLDISQVRPAFKQVCRKGVPQRMYRYPLVSIGFFASPVKRFLYPDRPVTRPGAREQPCSGVDIGCGLEPPSVRPWRASCNDALTENNKRTCL